MSLQAPIGPDQREQAAISWLQHALDHQVDPDTAITNALNLLRTARLERASQP